MCVCVSEREREEGAGASRCGYGRMHVLPSSIGRGQRRAAHPEAFGTRWKPKVFSCVMKERKLSCLKYSGRMS